MFRGTWYWYRSYGVVSKIITPEKNIFSELIRRGAIYYAGNFLPPLIFVELIMRSNSLYHIMWIDCFGGKTTPKNQ